MMEGREGNLYDSSSSDDRVIPYARHRPAVGITTPDAESPWEISPGRAGRGDSMCNDVRKSIGRRS